MNMPVEREIDFNRIRRRRCQKCLTIFEVEPAFHKQWILGDASCPNCGTPASSEFCARPWINPNEPTLRDELLTNAFWYHTSTCAQWPAKNYNPFDSIGEQAFREQFEHRIDVDAWAERQRNKALHLGTFEAAIHNIFRRIRNQKDGGKNFYIHRICVSSDAKIRPDWVYEQSNLVGDVSRDKICPKPFSITRYLNEFEDPGSISLAIRPEAVYSVQSISLDDLILDENLLKTVEDRLSLAELKPDLPPEFFFGIEMGSDRSPLHAEAKKIIDELSADIPPLLSTDSLSTDGIDEVGISAWTRRLIALFTTATNPSNILSQLNHKSIHYPST